jgi:AAA+ superfamily predicted ATPase
MAIEAGSLEITKDQLPDVWWRDFKHVPPTTRRAARYALQLIQWECQNSHWHKLREVENAWEIVAPLIDEKTANAAFNTFASDEDTPRRRLEEWQSHLLTQLPPGMLERLERDDGDLPVLSCIGLLAESLSLDAVEVKILDFLEKRLSVKGFCEFLRHREHVSGLENRQRLAAMLRVSESEIRRVLSQKSVLRETQLIEFPQHGRADLEDFIAPSDGLKDILTVAPMTQRALFDLLIESAPAPAWSLDDFPHLSAAAERLTTSLCRATEAGVTGVNALLFGSPGTGKTEFALAVAKEAGLSIYRVRASDDDGDGMGRQGRLTAYQIAQRMLKHRGDAVILFDEVEDVFGDDDGAVLMMLQGARQTGGQEKAWMNRLLEENHVPAIWITNDVEVMDPAFLRRFLLPVEFPIPPRSVRRRMVERHLGDCALPHTLLDELAADDKLAPAQFGDARKLLALHGAQEDAAVASRIVREGVASIRLLLHGSGLPSLRRSPTVFDVDFLNIAGGITPQRIAEGLARRGRGSLCFYGVPGTGKTEFAHVLADVLDRELVVKQSSDLISMYVGETEKNIARLFRTVDAERSMLFLDEVDSFLRDRQKAERSWEVGAPLRIGNRRHVQVGQRAGVVEGPHAFAQILVAPAFAFPAWR